MAENPEEFVLLMTRHQRKIWRFINALLPAPNAADDVLQETSLVLWRKWEQFDTDREFLPWACGIARLQVLRFVRENRCKPKQIAIATGLLISETSQRSSPFDKGNKQQGCLWCYFGEQKKVSAPH